MLCIEAHCSASPPEVTVVVLCVIWPTGQAQGVRSARQQSVQNRVLVRPQGTLTL